MGLIVIEDFLSSLTIRNLQNDLGKIKAEAEQAGKILETDGNIRFGHLLKYQSFADIIFDERIRGLVTLFLQSDPVLTSYSANIVVPGSPGMGCHRDYPYFSFPSHHCPNMPVLSVQIICALDDFTEDNGATRIVVGSHKLPNWMTQLEFNVKSFPLVLPKGSIIIMHGAVFHGVNPNSSSNSRRGILANFSHYWIRRFNENLGETEEQLELENARSLLGYNFKDMIRRDLAKMGYGMAKQK